MEVEMYGNYVGPQGEGTSGLGFFNLYGTCTASVINNHVYSGFWVHYAHSTIVTNPPPIVGNYGCGNISDAPGFFTNVHETSSYGTDITYQGNWRLGGRFCDPCLNPGLLCTGSMISASSTVGGGGFVFQGTYYEASPPDPDISDVSTSTGTMTIEII
jgi:hypothetical protein